MTFVSYAPNHEDVMLWRALKHIDAGFYIDVGAAWPARDSVTKAFYDRGWSGVNLQPNPTIFPDLALRRPRDINLPMAISAQAGEAKLYLVEGIEFSTLDSDLARRHLDQGLSVCAVMVAVAPLATIWSSHVPPDQPVHFLKINGGGLEGTVLSSQDWPTHRPWIVVVAANRPFTQIETYSGWQPILEEAGYDFAYADGLNRFYIAQEHREFLSSFKYPPNRFDNFMSASQQRMELALQAVSEGGLKSSAETESDLAYHWWMVANTLSAELKSIRSGYAWRILRPLSVFSKHSFSHFQPTNLSNGIARSTRAIFKATLFRLIRFIASRPALKTTALKWIYKNPDLETKIRKMISARQVSSLQADDQNRQKNEVETQLTIAESASIVSARITIDSNAPQATLDQIASEVMLSAEARILSSLKKES
ncbi:MAG: FkbM family methyltransferase [Nodosilinea sp.]